MTVTLGDGHALQAAGRGNVSLKMKLPQAKNQERTLQDVLFVPDLAYNLLSVTSAAKRGKVTTFFESTCEIKDAKLRLVASGHREGSLYYLDYEGATQQVHSIRSNENVKKGTIWHRRFGHLGVQSLQSLAKGSMVVGLDLDCSEEFDFCEPCTEGKCHRLPFEPRTSKRAEQPLELIHSDVCGKVGAKSLGGGEYFLTFVDDHTRCVWVYIMKKKDEVFKWFREWKAQVEKSTSKKVKTLRTDNGGEYTSTEFEAYLVSEGIRHEVTIPHTPQQNGVSERLNRTLVECVRTMLADSKLPHRFWAEALSTAVYLRNRSPTKALEGITPFEAWHGRKPDVSALRVFGCCAYVHIPKVERRKLDVKTRKCILLGYGKRQKGYRLYDLTRDKVIHGRDVLFNESSTPGIQKEQNDRADKYVQLDIEEEPTVEEPVTDESNGTAPENGEESEAQVPTTLDPPLRRSSRVRQQPDWFHGLVASGEQQDPSTVAEALSTPEKSKWEEAMENEMESIHSNGVWDLVEPPSNRKIVGSKWVYRRKTDADGNVKRYKARLVAQGCLGLDYEETFSPVVRFESVRSVIALGVHYQLQLHQMDVSTAFLHGELPEEVYMKQPS